MSTAPTADAPDFAKMTREELPLEFTLNLLKPIKFGKGDNVEIHTRIELQEPTLDQFDGFSKMARQKGEITALKHFIADVSNTPFVIIGLMGGRDMMLAQEYLLAFFRGSQTTGDTSPE